MSISLKSYISVEEYDENGKIIRCSNIDANPGETIVLDNIKVRFKQTEHCGVCGAPKTDWEKRNESGVYPAYDWYCMHCDHFVYSSNH